MTYRVGQGIDIHRFDAGRPLVLCGVRLNEGPGLEGHSDADVALHAVTDAILGAIGAGDIGEHFPPGDPRWCNAPSRVFVERALELAGERGFSIVNCDVTILGERPRLTPYKARLAAALADTLGVAPDRVGLKATTSERMGWIGRGEGLAALAVVLLSTDKTNGGAGER